MDDIEIDVNPVERYRRGKEALGVDEDSRPDEEVADSGENSGDAVEGDRELAAPG